MTREFNSDPGDEQQYLDAANEVAVNNDGGAADAQTKAVLNRLEKRLANAAGPIERRNALDAVSTVLIEVADRTGDRDDVLWMIRKGCSEVAGGAVNMLPADEIRDKLLPPVQNAATLTEGAGNSSSASLENGVALDEYLEDYLVGVKKVATRDHVSNSTFYRFKFTDGAVVEVTDEHQAPFDFWSVLDTASNVELKPETIGDAIADSDDPPVGDVTEEGSSAREMLKKLTPGPESRAWLTSEWQDCITNLVSEETEKLTTAEKSIGPRTDAWKDLVRKVTETRGVRNIKDAASEQIVYVHTRDDGGEEIWIPTKMADAACEDYATDRQRLACEINDRGAASPEVSGGGVSFESARTSPSSYWWRVELDHPEVQEPGSVVEELADDDEMWTGDDAGSSVGFGGDA